MKPEYKRIQKKSKIKEVLEKLHKYSYYETIAMVILFVGVGYLFNSHDVLFFDSRIPFLLIFLSVITLFHGFENGMLSVGIFAVVIALFYEKFHYVEFLTSLMMTLLFSEFHYYWTKRISEAEADSEFRNIKLSELSRAFYTLKISHDQLEKNYVTKPMSLRNSLLSIKDLKGDKSERFASFLKLLEKSFHVNIGTIVYKSNEDKRDDTYTMIASSEDAKEIVYSDPLIEKVLQVKKPVFISDDTSESDLYIAVIPAIQQEIIVGMLLIEKMPFLAFNRETLISISILFEYFFNEMKKQDVLSRNQRLQVIKDEEYKYEYFRLFEMKKLYNVDSTTFVIKTYSELLATRLHEKIDKLLRSLDMVTIIKHENRFYISIFFPLADKSAAMGFFNRLQNNMDDFNVNEVEYMSFGFDQIDIYEEYISMDSHG